MIAVIADDFTGAAELAGISLRYGLSVQLALPGVEYDGSDIFVVATDSRSLNKAEAMEVTGQVAEDLKRYQPDFIYKKIDSVLRGYVLAELKVQAVITDKDKIFILPANPSLGRTIEKGKYFIHGSEIHLTGFANDPEFATTGSSITELLRTNEGLKIIGINDRLADEGILIGEAGNLEDIKNWAGKIDSDWLLAGAGDFYSALLDKKFKKISRTPVFINKPHLYISGTTFDKSREYIKERSKSHGAVVYFTKDTVTSVLDTVSRTLKDQEKCIVAISEEVSEMSAAELRQMMAQLTRRILEENEIRELFIEGGSTAAAILNVLNLRTFTPVNEIQRGVVRMIAGDKFITVKPGSYEIPPQILEIYS